MGFEVDQYQCFVKVLQCSWGIMRDCEPGFLLAEAGDVAKFVGVTCVSKTCVLRLRIIYLNIFIYSTPSK